MRTTRWVQPAFLPGDAPVSPAGSKKSCATVRRRTRSPTSRSRGSSPAGWTRPTSRHWPGPRGPTISYAEPKYDESFPARRWRSLGVRNRVRCISPGEFWDAVPAVQYHMDEPMADAAAVALYFLNREAARDVKVVLSGEGADELFGGYNIYRDLHCAVV